jgi:hypothetical protein
MGGEVIRWFLLGCVLLLGGLIKHDFEDAQARGRVFNVKPGTLVSEAEIRPYANWSQTTLGGIFPEPSRNVGGTVQVLTPLVASGLVFFIIGILWRGSARPLIAATTAAVIAMVGLFILPFFVNFGVVY